MKSMLFKIGLPLPVLMIILVAGCIMSGTFVIVEKFTPTAESGFYYKGVDFTDNATWQEHGDQVDFIDAIGFELYTRSTATEDITFDIYVDNYSGPDASPDAVPGTATKVIEGVTVSPGTKTVTYAESLKLIKGLDRLKTLAKTGQMDLYGTSTGGVGSTFVIDSIKVVVTFSASE
jgi:hypothetical protein